MSFFWGTLVGFITCQVPGKFFFIKLPNCAILLRTMKRWNWNNLFQPPNAKVKCCSVHLAELYWLTKLFLGLLFDIFVQVGNGEHHWGSHLVWCACYQWLFMWYTSTLACNICYGETQVSNVTWEPLIVRPQGYEGLARKSKCRCCTLVPRSSSSSVLLVSYKARYNVIRPFCW